MVRWVIGVDEVGRGPLAGPVAVAAVLWRRARFRPAAAFAAPGRRGKVATKAAAGLHLSEHRDSKRLSVQQREAVFARLKERRRAGWLDFTVSLVGERTIDQRGIVAAVRLGIRRCLARFNCRPEQCSVLLDGALRAPRQYLNQKTIIRGDETEPIIALASVAAKVRRDRKMVRFAARHPAYGFERHKGYGTKAHYRAIREHGLLPLHRRSFLKQFD